MAINQIISLTEHDNESQGSTHNSSSATSDEESLTCSEYEVAHGEVDTIVKRIRRDERSRGTPSQPSSLRASAAWGKKSLANTFANRKGNAKSKMMMMKRLHVQLDSLRSLLPHTARSSRPCNVIADALKYRKTLEKEIELLLTALPYSQQVHVRRVECGGLQIGLSCKKKSGLMVALMEAMESFGLQFASMNVSCQDDNIVIDALSTQEGVGKAGALKGMLIATIMRFSRRP